MLLTEFPDATVRVKFCAVVRFNAVIAAALISANEERTPAGVLAVRLIFNWP